MDLPQDPWDPALLECWRQAVVDQGHPGWSAREININNMNMMMEKRPTQHKQVLCLTCQIPMVVKFNKSTGEEFLGCPNYKQRHCLSATLDGVFSKGHKSPRHSTMFFPNFSTWNSGYTSYPSDMESAVYEDYSIDIGDR